MFHLRDGFYFERLPGGYVRIRYAQPVIGRNGSPTGDLAVIAQTTVPENEWGSVLASVSALGETRETWHVARAYHDGELFDKLREWGGAPCGTASAAVPGTCEQPPEGWFCTLEAGHEGSCPTWPEACSANRP